MKTAFDIANIQNDQIFIPYSDYHSRGLSEAIAESPLEILQEGYLHGDTPFIKAQMPIGWTKKKHYGFPTLGLYDENAKNRLTTEFIDDNATAGLLSNMTRWHPRFQIFEKSFMDYTEEEEENKNKDIFEKDYILWDRKTSQTSEMDAFGNDFEKQRALNETMKKEYIDLNFRTHGTYYLTPHPMIQIDKKDLVQEYFATAIAEEIGIEPTENPNLAITRTWQSNKTLDDINLDLLVGLVVCQLGIEHPKMKTEHLTNG